MKNHLIILLIVAFSLPGISQLTQDFAQQRFDEIYELELEQPDVAIIQYQEVGKEAIRRIDRGRAYSYIGMVYLAQGDYDSLDHYMGLALSVFEEEDYPRGTASVYNTIGNANLYRGYYTSALEAYQKALPYYEQPGQEYNLTVILNNVASMFQHNEDQETSLVYLRRALDISKDLADKKAIANSYNNISAAYIQLEDHEAAYQYADSAAMNIATTDDTRLQVLMYANLARTCVNREDFQRARQVLAKVEELIILIDDIESAITLHQSWANYYLKSRDYNKAILYGEKALVGLSTFEDQRYEEEVLRTLYLSAQAMGKNELALAYYQRMDTVRTNSFLSIRNARVDELEAIYQNEKKEKILVAQELQINKQAANKNLLIAIIGIIGLIGVSTWLMLNRRKQQIENDLKIERQKTLQLEQEQRINALNYIVQGQEEERRRIAQDLHDGLGGLLTTVRRKVGTIQSAIDDLSNTSIIKETETLIENACDEVRRISHDMMPATLSSLGLQDAIEDLAADLIPTRISFSLTYTLEENALSEKIKVNLYRIIQEVLTNTVRHSDATALSLSLTSEPNHLSLKAQDNGKGLDTTKTTKENGIGLKNIQSRVKYLNGSFNIESENKKGVLIQIKIPKEI